MTKREIVRLVLEGQRPPYVPWSMGFTLEARQKLQAHWGCDDVETPLGNHLPKLGRDIGLIRAAGQPAGARRVRCGVGSLDRQGHRQRARSPAGTPRPGVNTRNRFCLA